MQIVPHPHPALRFRSVPVVRIDDNLRKIVREMFELMYAAEGIGLAANQVGLGRDLFANFRRNALTAEEGACTWL